MLDAPAARTRYRAFVARVAKRYLRRDAIPSLLAAIEAGTVDMAAVHDMLSADELGGPGRLAGERFERMRDELDAAEQELVRRAHMPRCRSSRRSAARRRRTSGRRRGGC
jgi:hypothetical protein